MPKRKEVARLEELCLRAVGSLVASLGEPIRCAVRSCKDVKSGIRVLEHSIRWIVELLASHVPYYLYDAMSAQVLEAVKRLIERTKKSFDPYQPLSAFLTDMNVVVTLTECVLTERLRRIDFSAWPKMMRYVLYKNFTRLTGLEVCNLGSCTGGWRTVEYDRCISEAVRGMKHLRSLCLCFDCTDAIVQTVAESCAALESLDVTSSRSVTDRSVPHLMRCRQLRDLQLHRTSVTAAGFAQLLVGLPSLQDLGRCDDFGAVVRCAHDAYPQAGPFGLRRLQTRDVSTEDLRLLARLCPRIDQVSLFHDEQISDLTVLTTLDDLTELKLLCCDFYTDSVQRLLEAKGRNVLSLHLEHVEEIDLDALRHISRCCPRLRSLVFYNCEFLEGGASGGAGRRAAQAQAAPRPFEHLERIFCVADCAGAHLEYLLSNCVNIRDIHLGSSTGIVHALLARILAVNPMRRLQYLRILYSSDLNIESVYLLLASCTDLKVLSELESWQGITLAELSAFREYIYANNFDLDISPTLSY